MTWDVKDIEVLKCVMIVGHNCQLSEGMETPEYRRVALQCMIAFKVLANNQWEKFLVN